MEKPLAAYAAIRVLCNKDLLVALVAELNSDFKAALYVNLADIIFS